MFIQFETEEDGTASSYLVENVVSLRVVEQGTDKYSVYYVVFGESSRNIHNVLSIRAATDTGEPVKRW